MARILSFFCLFFALRSHAQDTSHVVTLKANSQEKQYKKILIAGCGPVAIRHFIESLAPQLTAHYEKKGVICVYEYIGDNPGVLKAGVSAAFNNHQPDATLIMYQLEEAPDTLKTKHPSRVPRAVLMGGERFQQRKRVKNLNSHIDEEVKLAMLEGKNMAPVWQGQLNIIDEKIRDYLYEKICFILAEELYKNKIPSPSAIVN
jgi:hypothetical protein